MRQELKIIVKYFFQTSNPNRQSSPKKMNNLVKSILSAGLVGGIAVSTHAQQVFVSDDFESYETTSEMEQSWGTGNATLDTEFGNPGQSALHTGGAVNEWQSPFSIRPTSDLWIELSFDFFDPGGALGRQSVGLRTGSDPLFEMGANNADFGQYAIRVLNFHGNEGWVYFEPGTEEDNIRESGWHSMHAVITETETTVTLTLESGAQFALVSTGAFSDNDFTDLRFGGPSDVSSSIDWNYDNIVLQTVPEPSTYAAIFGALALAGAFVMRRRRSVK